MLTLTGPPENLRGARDMCLEMMVSSHPEASSSAHPPAQSAAPSARPVPSAAPSASARPVPSAAPSARFSAAPSAAHPARRAAQPLPPPAPGVAAAWQSGPVDVMMAWHAARCAAWDAFWSMSTPCGMHALAATGAQHPMGWAGGTAWPQQWDYHDDGAPCWGSGAWADSAGAASGAAAAADVPTAQGSAATADDEDDDDDDSSDDDVEIITPRENVVRLMCKARPKPPAWAPHQPRSAPPAPPQAPAPSLALHPRRGRSRDDCRPRQDDDAIDMTPRKRGRQPRDVYVKIFTSGNLDVDLQSANAIHDFIAQWNLLYKGKGRIDLFVDCTAFGDPCYCAHCGEHSRIIANIVKKTEKVRNLIQEIKGRRWAGGV